MNFIKAQLQDLPDIQNILSQWKKSDQVKHFLDQLRNLSTAQFFLVKDNDQTLGLVAIDNLASELSQFSTSENPKQITLLHVDGNASGKGVGRFLSESIEKEAISQHITQLIVTSPNRYKMGKIGFYEKMGYEKVGKLEVDRMLNNIFSKTIE